MDISTEAQSRSPPLHVSLLKACQPGPYSHSSDARLDTLYQVGADGVLRSFDMWLNRPDVLDAVALSPAQIQAHIDHLTSESSTATDSENQKLRAARVRLEALFRGVDGTEIEDHETLMQGPKSSEAFDRDMATLNLQCRQLHQAILARSETATAEARSCGGQSQYWFRESNRRARANSYYSMEGR